MNWKALPPRLRAAISLVVVAAFVPVAIAKGCRAAFDSRYDTIPEELAELGFFSSRLWTLFIKGGRK